MPQYSPLRHATGRDLCLLLLCRYRRFRVTGDSMMPVLSAHQEVLLNPAAYQNQLPQPDDIVVAYHPHQPSLRIIKRVLFVEPDGRCYLRGDNQSASTDSRQFGLIPREQIYGQVLCLFP
ncbi:MAG: nickel-type superoxide dismutase maturation protease [Cyanobacteria bacterium P01_C01_bin.120]